jgi:hypothetical protein
VQKTGLSQWKRAGSARTCSFHRASERRSEAARRHPNKPATQPPRRAAILAPRAPPGTPMQSVLMRCLFRRCMSLLYSPSRPSCGVLRLVGRREGRRPSSLSMAVHAGLRARSDRLRRRKKGVSQAKRGAGCWPGGKRPGPRMPYYCSTSVRLPKGVGVQVNCQLRRSQEG